MKKKDYLKDKFSNLAKSEGYIARSIYKLSEIDRRAQLLKKNITVCDFGCSPGSWLQYISPKIGPKGYCLGIDINPVKVNFTNVKTEIKDIFKLTIEDKIFVCKPFDLILSDAMINTTGVTENDYYQSVELVQCIVDLCKQGLLKKNGKFLAKIFEGEDFQTFYPKFKKVFTKTKVYKPEASRKESRERFIFGILK